MKFDEMSPEERVEYKKQVLADFIEHGMSEEEAIVNYVFCVNSDPLRFLELKYKISGEDAMSMKTSGFAVYRKNGGTYSFESIAPEKKKHKCKCRQAMVPHF